MTLRKFVLAIKQPLLHVTLYLSVVVHRMSQLRKRLGKLGFNFTLKDFRLNKEG